MSWGNEEENLLDFWDKIGELEEPSNEGVGFKTVTMEKAEPIQKKSLSLDDFSSESSESDTDDDLIDNLPLGQKISQGFEEDTNFRIEEVKVNQRVNRIIDIKKIEVSRGNIVILDESNVIFYFKRDEKTITFSLGNNDTVKNIFLSPNGLHMIIISKKEIYYHHISSSKAFRKPRKVKELRGLKISCVCWNGISKNKNDVTGRLLIGTKNSRIYELEIGLEKKKIKIIIFRELFNLQERKIVDTTGSANIGEITGIAVKKLLKQEYYIMVATRVFIFEFYGEISYKSIFDKYLKMFRKESILNLLYKEVPSFGGQDDMKKSELHLLKKSEGFAWLCATGIYHGTIRLNSKKHPKNKFIHSHMESLILESEIIINEEEQKEILSILIIEFHMFVLYEDSLCIYLQPPGLCGSSMMDGSNTPSIQSDIHNEFGNITPKIGIDDATELNQNSMLNLKKVFEYKFNKTLGSPIGLLKDCETKEIYLYTDSRLWKVTVLDPEKNVWKLYLERGKSTKREKYFDMASVLAKNDAKKKNIILSAKANFLFDNGMFEKSAVYFAQTPKNFEDVCKKFYHLSNKKYLITYLNNKLKFIKYYAEKERMAMGNRGTSKTSHGFKIQICCLITWIIELYLNEINEFGPSVEQLKSPRHEENDNEKKTVMKEKRKGKEHDEHDIQTMFKKFREKQRENEGRIHHPLNIPKSPSLFLNNSKRQSVSSSRLREEFHLFLEENKEHLPEFQEVLFQMFTSHYQIEELVYFGVVIEEFEFVLNTFLTEGLYDEALDILRHHCAISKHEGYWYKYAPILIEKIPKRVFKTLKQDRFKFLKSEKFLPCLMKYLHSGRFGSSSDNNQNDDIDDEEENAVIQFLQWVIGKQKKRNSAIHNLLLYLYSRLKKDDLLMNYLESQYGIYDNYYALRTCRENEKLRAEIFLLDKMGLYEDAVTLCLNNNMVNEAKEYTCLIPDDKESTRKKLWEKILKFLIQKERNVKTGIELFKQMRVRTSVKNDKMRRRKKRRSGRFDDDEEAVKFEDIIPFFPKFALINDYFKEEICNALKEYDIQIKYLKERMVEQSEDTEKIKGEIRSIRWNYRYVNTNMSKCNLCEENVFGMKFFMFPCNHMFHFHCLIKEVKKFTSSFNQKRIDDMIQQIDKLKHEETSKKKTNILINTINQTSSKTKVLTNDLKGIITNIISGKAPVAKIPTTPKEGIVQIKSNVIEEVNKEKSGMDAKKERKKLEMKLDSLISDCCPYCDLMIDSVDEFLVEKKDLRNEGNWRIVVDRVDFIGAHKQYLDDNDEEEGDSDLDTTDSEDESTL